MLSGFEDHRPRTILSSLQNRLRIAWTRLTRHPHDRRRRRKNFQTTATATRTRNTTKRIDTHVSNLSRSAVNTTPQFPVENDAATDTRAKCQTDDRLTTDGRALPHLPARRRIRIVLEYGRKIKPAR